MVCELFDGFVVIVVNSGLLLVFKMVKEGFGVVGNDLNIGVNILIEVVFGVFFVGVFGKYFDNDSCCFVYF